jgi:hypothetical protein
MSNANAEPTQRNEDLSDANTSVPRTLAAPDSNASSLREVGGRNGPEPTRFGDWEKNGRCIDF